MGQKQRKRANSGKSARPRVHHTGKPHGRVPLARSKHNLHG
ncbi:hypothetical protein F383_38663 [Gossypium arboreum]|uniref:Uncharacterized protein n=1 Tax=Gossypium arboreum TaxID=29729 RepID=A0A0B0MHI5_GOSAR|nr:hypothetical protein F383_38663 [Gossypium arboreum]